MPRDDRPVVIEARVVTGSGGGPDKTILNSPRFLEQHGYRAICAYLRPPRDAGFEQLRQRARAWDAPLYEVDDRGPLDLGVFRSLLRLCRAEKVAIWHGHDYKTNLIGLLLSRFWPMKLVTTVHGWVRNTARTPLYYRLDRWSLKHYDRVVCVSDDLLEICLAAGVPQLRCLLIENAIDSRQFSRTLSTAEAKQRLGLRDDRLLVGAVGRLSPEKGFDRLIEASAELMKQGLEFDVAIAGDGDDRARLQQMIDAAGRAQQIRLLGFCPNTVEWYQAMDIFALSSLREGLPNVLLEAMAFSVPVIATSIAGIPRLVQHGENGWLIRPESTEDLSAGLQQLLGNPLLRQRLGEAGRRTILSSYSFDARMRKFSQLFDELLLRSQRPTPIAAPHEQVTV